MDCEVATFSESNQVKLILKMKLSNYAWYNDCIVVFDGANYSVLVGIKRINDKINNIIPKRIGNVFIKLKVDKYG